MRFYRVFLIGAQSHRDVAEAGSFAFSGYLFRVLKGPEDKLMLELRQSIRTAFSEHLYGICERYRKLLVIRTTNFLYA